MIELNIGSQTIAETQREAVTSNQIQFLEILMLILTFIIFVTITR